MRKCRTTCARHRVCASGPLFPVWALVVAGLALTGCGDRPGPEAEAVVLVHGLGRTATSMILLEQRLVQEGFRVARVGYDSRGSDFAEQIGAVTDTVAACCAQSSRIHFVGHSLGGLLIRGYLARTRPDRLGRVVLLAPPSAGSFLVDRLQEIPMALDALGPVDSALGTDSTDIPATLPPPDYEIGIIAGNRSINPIGTLTIPGPDDGVVGVEETRIKGVPIVVLPVTHTFIMNNPRTARAVVHFLRTGNFGSDSIRARPH